MLLKVQEGTNGITFEIKVQPGAKKTEITGLWNQAMKIKISKKPEQGAANKACMEFLAKQLRIPRQHVEIIKGEFSTRKVIRVKGTTVAAVQDLVAQL